MGVSARSGLLWVARKHRPLSNAGSRLPVIRPGFSVPTTKKSIHFGREWVTPRGVAVHGNFHNADFVQSWVFRPAGEQACSPFSRIPYVASDIPDDVQMTCMTPSHSRGLFRVAVVKVGAVKCKAYNLQ